MTYNDIISDSNPHEKYNKRLQNFPDQIGYDLHHIFNAIHHFVYLFRAAAKNLSRVSNCLYRLKFFV